MTEVGLGQLKIDEFISNYKFSVQLFERMRNKVEAIARVFVLDGFNFAQKDLFSLSDPYLILKCGNKTFNERKEYQLDTCTPKFYKVYDFLITFPGASILSIDSYDYDDFFGDDHIGQTKIDLDDRFYNKDWCAVSRKPIEYRDLYHPASTIPQGTVKMWLNILPLTSKKADTAPPSILPEPNKEFEVRLTIWKTKDIEMMDLEGTSDVFVRSFLDADDDYLTDTHWRCTTGIASFNWMNLIKAKSRQKEYNLSIQTWDKDIIASNDLIGDFNLDIAPLMEDVYLTGKSKVFNKKFWNDYMK